MRNIHDETENVGGYGGKQKLKKVIFDTTGVRYADSDIENWLMMQDAYTLHKTARHKRNKVLVNSIDRQFQLHLVDMSTYSAGNNGVRYLLTCIDLFSKYAWVCCLKNKSGKCVTASFKDIFAEGRIPHKIQTDEGKDDT